MTRYLRQSDPTPKTVRAAANMARQRHHGQFYDEFEFTHHLKAVVAEVFHWGMGTPALLAAAWLHDIVEDTDTTLAEVQARFGDEVAALVDAVTDSAEGKNRRERKANTYAKTAANRDAVYLKLCDRIANVRASVENRRRGQGKDLLKMYRREHPSFRSTLHEPGEYDDMWGELDTLLGLTSG